MKYQNLICDAIETLTAAAVENVSYDRTIIGTVLCAIDINTRQATTDYSDYYCVKYQDAKLYARNASPLYSYKQGCLVYVLIADGDFSGDKIILAPAADDYEISKPFLEILKKEVNDNGKQT